MAMAVLAPHPGMSSKFTQIHSPVSTTPRLLSPPPPRPHPSPSSSSSSVTRNRIRCCSETQEPKVFSQSNGSATTAMKTPAQILKRCLRCNSLYSPARNSPTACSFHGHVTGEKGLFASAPPHQGIDGEWTDRSGVIVYKWNNEEDRPNTGSANWKKRWSCCSEYDENAPPCRRGWHVSYDDGFTLY